MKSHFWLFSCLLLGLSSCSGESEPTISSGSALLYVNSQNRVKVGCSFNGHENTCILDTGSVYSSLPVADWGLQLPSQGSVKISSVGGTSDCDLVSLDSMVASRISFEAPTISRCPKGGLYGSSGVIGMDVLDAHILNFDFQSKTLTKETTLPSPLKSYNLKRSSEKHIYVQVKMGSEWIDAVWDTGISSGALIDRNFVKTHQDRFAFERTSSVSDAFGKTLSVDVYSLSDLRIGDITFEDQEVLVTDFSNLAFVTADNVHFILGMAMIKQANWDFDLLGNKWFITKVTPLL